MSSKRIQVEVSVDSKSGRGRFVRKKGQPYAMVEVTPPKSSKLSRDSMSRRKPTVRQQRVGTDMAAYGGDHHELGAPPVSGMPDNVSDAGFFPDQGVGLGPPPPPRSRVSQSSKSSMQMPQGPNHPASSRSAPSIISRSRTSIARPDQVSFHTPEWQAPARDQASQASTVRGPPLANNNPVQPGPNRPASVRSASIVSPRLKFGALDGVQGHGVFQIPARQAPGKHRASRVSIDEGPPFMNPASSLAASSISSRPVNVPATLVSSSDAAMARQPSVASRSSHCSRRQASTLVKR